MKEFPPNTKFRYSWRPYQARVLSELEEYLTDNRLHLSAAPGSGKTLLGLEVVRRLNRPTLILSPTIAIRDQWVSRLVYFFLPDNSECPSWISTDIRNPKFLTVSTYQGLYSACTGIDEEESDNDDEIEDDEDISIFGLDDIVIKSLRAVDIQTVVLDEAHHLRSKWWRVLIDVLEELKDCKVLSLTATPPYDVSIYEWERYQELCGPIDAEVTVPELVLEQNLCPHQDLVLFSHPNLVEDDELKEFKTAVKRFIKDIKANTNFIQLLKDHPWVQNPNNHIEMILENPPLLSSMLIFLKDRGIEIPNDALELIAGDFNLIPRFNDVWLEILLEGLLFPPNLDPKDLPDVLKQIKQQAYRIDVLERRKVHFESNRRLDAVLKRSITKLYAIQAIVALELKSLKENLRMVILTDFIRRAYLPKTNEDITELDQIGVVPIFEMIRRTKLQGCRLGVLSGSLVIIPSESEQLLQKSASECDIEQESIRLEKLFDEKFMQLELRGSDSQRIVELVTELFNSGGINVLVGTKSLLGEGWDAPSINSLVLASFVGSYMLSNQMRGRAIRIDPNQPDKTSNIWHLICVELDSENPGNDYQTMIRRFKAFLGVSFLEPVIENGFTRLGICEPPFSEDLLQEINAEMRTHALDRESLRSIWEKSLRRGEEGVRLVESVEIKSVHLPVPRGFEFKNTLEALVWEILLILGFFLARQLLTPFFSIPDLGIAFLAVLPLLGFLFFIVRFLPKTAKAVWLFFKHGPVKSSLKQVGITLLKSLCEVNLILSNYSDMKVIVSEGSRGSVFCHVEGSTRRERALYLDGLKELMGPIESPRYLLQRKSKLWGIISRFDYHSVPSVLGVKKELAETFAQNWSHYVGEMDLIYTRTRQGRIALIQARNHSLSAAFVPRSERVSRWK
jgi:superfamily II DNA or RNA helicase